MGLDITWAVDWVRRSAESMAEHRVELIVPRVRVACSACGAKLERLAWLEPYARITGRLADSVARLCAVASIRHVAQFFGLHWNTVKEIDRAHLQRSLANEA